MLNSKEILKNTKIIAVIGASNNTTKAAHRIPKYLQDVFTRCIYKVHAML